MNLGKANHPLEVVLALEVNHLLKTNHLLEVIQAAKVNHPVEVV